MHKQRTHRVTGHVLVYEGKRGRTFVAKYRLPDGRQVKRRLGPEWKGKGRPPSGHFTRSMAEAELQAILTDARRGTLAGMFKTGATFRDAAEEWYRHGKDEQGKRGTPWKPSTARDHRSVLNRHLIPAFGERPIESITTRQIEAWRSERLASGEITRRTAVKLVAIMHGIFERARRLYEGLNANPVQDVERLKVSYSGRFDFYSPEEVWALCRSAASEQDGAIYLTAAFTGMRMGELLALRWRDVGFTAETIRVFGSVDHRAGVGTPKSGHGRSVPMVPDVATALARLGQREHFTGPDDFAFANETGGYLDNSALRRRFKSARDAAELRPLRFHDLRHSFGSLAINKGSTRDVQEWLGHADSRTTARYTHYKSRANEAKLLADAFKVAEPEQPEAPEPSEVES